jgi:hypothetical protein
VKLCLLLVTEEVCPVKKINVQDVILSELLQQLLTILSEELKL